MDRLGTYSFHPPTHPPLLVFTELLLDDFDNNFSRTAAYLGLCAGVERGVQFFSSPFLGNLSDSMGRRPILLGSLLLHLVSLLIVTLGPSKSTVLIYFVVNGGCNVTLGKPPTHPPTCPLTHPPTYLPIHPLPYHVDVYSSTHPPTHPTKGMINAIVADLCTAQGKTGDGQLAQQYGKLGMAIGFSMILGR